MDIASLLFPLLILLLFVPIFLSSRRQKKAMADAAALQASLEPGDIVVTTSGLRATVVDASYEETVDLEIADDVVTTWVRAAIREKVSAVPDDAAELDEGTDDAVSLDKGSPVLDKSAQDKPVLATDESTNGAPQS